MAGESITLKTCGVGKLQHRTFLSGKELRFNVDGEISKFVDSDKESFEIPLRVCVCVAKYM